MSKCEYPNDCPIEPLVKQQESLTTERDRLYFSVRETNDLEEVAGLIAKTQEVQGKIDEIEKKKNFLHPCPRCLYQ